MTLKELKDQRAAKFDEIEALNTLAKTQSRDLTTDEYTTQEANLNTLADLDKKIEVRDRMDKAAATRATTSTTTESTSISANDVRDLKKFSLVRGLQLMAQGKPLDGIEAEVHAEAAIEARQNGINLQGFGVPTFLGEKRGQTATGTTTVAGDQGGFSVPTEVNGLIEALWANSFLGEVGARRIAGLRGNQDFLVQATKPTAQELTEIQEMVDDEITFTEFSMAPNRRGTSIPVSKQLLLQSSIDVNSLIFDNLRKALDYKLNVDAYTKLAAAVTGSNLLAIGADGGAPTYDHIVALEGMVDALEANSATSAYLTNSKVRSKLKRTQIFSGTSGEPVWGSDNMVNGYKGVVSNILPSNLTKGAGAGVGVCSPIFFGDFSYLYVGMWGGIDFVVDIYTLAKKGQVAITANMFWDVEVARAASFAGIKDATTV